MAIHWPLRTVIVTGEFGNSPDFYAQFGQAGHNGIDLAAAIGTPVYATDSGTVDAEGWGSGDSWMGSIAGIFVRIRHWWGYSAYAHLNSTIVDAGQWVNAKQLIGYSGATGVGTGPHLHVETFPLNPNFGNGFAGRINPRTLGLVPHTDDPAPAPPAPAPVQPPVDEDPMPIRKSIPQYAPNVVCEPGQWTRLRFNKDGDMTLLSNAKDLRRGTANVAISIKEDVEFLVRIVYDTISADGKKVLSTKGSVRARYNQRGLYSWPIGLSGGVPKRTRIRVQVQPVGDKPITVTSIRPVIDYWEK